MEYIIVPIIGFSNGIIVGSGIVALITLLDIIPRLVQITKTYDYITTYENIIIYSAATAAFFSLAKIGTDMGIILIIVTGFFMGIFIGLLASALAEVMNVIPIIIRRFQIEEYVIYIVYSLILGKTMGSILHWLFLNL